MCFRKKTSGEAGLSPDRREPDVRVGGVQQRVIAALGASTSWRRAANWSGCWLGGAVRDARAGRDRGAGRPDPVFRRIRAGLGVRAPVGRDRLPSVSLKNLAEERRARVRAWSGRSSSPCCTELMGGRCDFAAGSLARGLSKSLAPRRSSCSISTGDGMARPRIAGRGAGRAHAVRPAFTKDLVEERLFAHRRDLFSHSPRVHGRDESLLKAPAGRPSAAPAS